MSKHGRFYRPSIVQPLSVQGNLFSLRLSRHLNKGHISVFRLTVDGD